MTVSVDALRDRLASREAVLDSLRSRLKTVQATPTPKSTISDIQRRYLSAVADLETKRSTTTATPIVRSTNDGVSSLASKWNKGMDGKKVERSNVEVRGDVSSARKTFAAADVPRVNPSSGTSDDTKTDSSTSTKPQPAQLLVEDDDGLPSWAKNQRKLVIRKENARSSIRDVDVRELQGSVMTAPDRNEENVKSEKIEARGNVKAALAMWGKTADEDAKLLVKKKEEEERQRTMRAKMRKDREEEERKHALRKAMEKFADMRLVDMKDEPENDVDLMAFLERKIALIDEEISSVEDELEKLEASNQ